MKELAIKQLEVNEQIVKALGIVKEIIATKDDKQYNKRIVTAINDELFKHFKMEQCENRSSMLVNKSEGYTGFDYLNIMNTDRNIKGQKDRNGYVSTHYVGSYTVDIRVFYNENKKIDAEKTIANIDSYIQSMTEGIEKLRNNIDNYEQLKQRRKEIQEMVREFNSSLHYGVGELGIRQ